MSRLQPRFRRAPVGQRKGLEAWMAGVLGGVMGTIEISEKLALRRSEIFFRPF
jgi:hypothetical protein